MADSEDHRDFLVTAETIHGPRHNGEILGRVVTLDLTEYETTADAAEEAKEKAVESMTERRDEIVSDEFKVYEVTDSFHFPIPDDLENVPTA